MKIAYNPTSLSALTANSVEVKSNDIIFDLPGQAIWAKERRFGGLVTNGLDGMVPKYDGADGTIDNATNDWVLTVNNGSLGWYKLPATAFLNTNTTYTLSGALSGNNFITTLTPSSGTASTATIPVMVGATSSAAGKAGLIPAPGTADVGKFLKGDGTWATIPSNWVTHLYVGAKDTASNAATGNGSTYIKITDNSTIRNQYLIKGTGRSTVVSDASGNIIIDTPTVTWSEISGKPSTFTPSSHNHPTSLINALTDYTKATAVASLATTDTLNTALGKLEYKLDIAYNLVKGANDSDGTIENLKEIFDVLAGIKDTDTIQAIIGKYLPLTGGTLTGNVTAPSFIGNLTGNASTATTASQLSNTSVSDPAKAASGQYLKWYSAVAQASGYAGNNYGFPVTSNANGILWLGTHSGPYGGLLGISSNGGIYYRFVTNNSFLTTANGGSWNKVAWVSDLPTKTSLLTNDSGYLVQSDLANYVTTNTALNITGAKTFLSDITLYTASGDSKALIFNRGTATDGVVDWKMYVTNGVFKLLNRTSTDAWDDVINFSTLSNKSISTSYSITATKFIGPLQGNADTATKLGTATKGSATKPIYLNAGTPTECTTYAGGTAVTLNGTSASGSTASFYAPTGAGSAGQILKSNGSGAPVWSTIASIMQNLTIKIKSGSTEGTDLYTYDGSAAKSIDIKLGSNITLTAAAGALTIAAVDTKVTDAASTNKAFLLGHATLGTNATTLSNSLVFMEKGELFASNLWGIKSESINIALDNTWKDTGIVFSTAKSYSGTGSYVILISSTTGMWTGYFALRTLTGETSNTTIIADEIILQGGDAATYLRPYLRTLNDHGNNRIKLQISHSESIAAKDWTIKFKRVI